MRSLRARSPNARFTNVFHSFLLEDNNYDVTDEVAVYIREAPTSEGSLLRPLWRKIYDQVQPIDVMKKVIHGVAIEFVEVAATQQDAFILVPTPSQSQLFLNWQIAHELKEKMLVLVNAGPVSLIFDACSPDEGNVRFHLPSKIITFLNSLPDELQRDHFMARFKQSLVRVLKKNHTIKCLDLTDSHSSLTMTVLNSHRVLQLRSQLLSPSATAEFISAVMNASHVEDVPVAAAAAVSAVAAPHFSSPAVGGNDGGSADGSAATALEYPLPDLNSPSPHSIGDSEMEFEWLR